jgi:hypothetical protein
MHNSIACKNPNNVLLNFQAIILAELQRQAADLQNKQVVEMAMLASYRDRNLVAEVDALRRELEHTSSRVQQLGTEGEQTSSTSALKQGLLAADIERLKAQVSELEQAQQGMKAEVSRNDSRVTSSRTLLTYSPATGSSGLWGSPAWARVPESTVMCLILSEVCRCQGW